MNDIPDHVPMELVRAFDEKTDPLLLKEPFQAFYTLHEEGWDIFYNPAAWMGEGGWVIVNGAWMKEVLQSPDLFSSKKGTGFGDLMGDPDFDLIPLELDPPEHTKFRVHFNKPLSPQAVAEREETVREKAVSLIENFRGEGGCEFVEEFATPFPVDIFMLLMGLPASDRREILGYAHNLVSFEVTPETRQQAAKNVYQYLLKLLKNKQENPGDDLATLILGFEVDGRPVTDREVLEMYYLLLIGGLDTVTSSLGFAFKYLANHPDALTRLCEQPALIPGAVEEFLRMHSVAQGRRLVTRDTEFHGVQLKKGDSLIVSPCLGSLDPDEFENPMVPDFERRPNRHLAFAIGPHRCMGSNLARMELRIVLEEWFKRIPSFSIQQGTSLETTYGPVMALKRLPLVW